MKADPFPGKALELKRLEQAGVKVVDRLVGTDGKTVTFADRKAAQIETIIWASG